MEVLKILSFSIKHWFPLDNSAKIYPFMMNDMDQNSFKVTASLKSSVNPIVLQNALEETILRFPSFRVFLKKGIFWYYLDFTNSTPSVEKESPFLLQPIKVNYTSNCFNFRMTYFENRISLDVFHILADGAGALEFMKTLLYCYFEKSGISINAENKIILPTSPTTSEEVEDSFSKFFTKRKIKDLNVDALKGTEAYKIEGLPLPKGVKGLIEGKMDAHKLLDLSKSYGCTLTEFLSALIMYSIYKTKIRTYDKTSSIQLFIPINLRKHFKSKTLRNFSLFSRVGANIDSDNLDIQFFIESIKQTLRHDLQKDILKNKIDTMVMAEKIFISRIAPLPLKKLVFTIANTFFGKNKKTCTFSNLGVLQLPSSFEPYVDDFSLNINVSRKNNFSVAAITCFDSFKISFSRYFSDTSIEHFFFSFLIEKGIDVTISSNFAEMTYEMQ